MLKNKYEKSKIEWKLEIINKIKSNLHTQVRGSSPEVQVIDLSLPKNIAPTPCPSYDELRKGHFSRFQ